MCLEDVPCFLAGVMVRTTRLLSLVLAALAVASSSGALTWGALGKSREGSGRAVGFWGKKYQYPTLDSGQLMIKNGSIDGSIITNQQYSVHTNYDLFRS